MLRRRLFVFQKNNRDENLISSENYQCHGSREKEI